MRWLGVRRVQVRRVILPGDFAARLADPRIADRAESIGATGGEPINFPVVRTDKRLLCGADRVAALVQRGAKSFEARIVECDEDEAQELQIRENLDRRRDDRDELMRRLVELRASRLARLGLLEAGAQPSPELLVKLSNNSEGPGRPKEIRTVAREQVAAETGRTVEAVRAAERRAAAKDVTEPPAEAAAAAPAAAPTPPPPPIETWGLPLTDEDAATVRAVHAAIDEADRHLRAAQTALTKLEAPGIVHLGYSTHLKRDVHEAADSVRRDRPVALCPYCARLERLMRECSACGGRGLATADVLTSMPPELRDPAPRKMVIDGGRMVLLSVATKIRVPPAKAPAVTPKRLQIQDEHGNPLRLPK